MSDEINTLHNDVSTAPVIETLEKTFDILNKVLFNSALLKPVITLSKKGTKSTNDTGWCTEKEVWMQTKDGQIENKYYEINIYPEHLNRSVEEICAMLLHEMVHLFNTINGIQDRSKNGQYHNKHFKISAEQHGLNVEQVKYYGYAKTSLNAEAIEIIKGLDLTAFDLYRESEQKSSSEKKTTGSESSQKKSSTRKYICPECKTSIRATKEVRIICGDCEELFEESNREEKENSDETFKPIHRLTVNNSEEDNNYEIMEVTSEEMAPLKNDSDPQTIPVIPPDNQFVSASESVEGSVSYV